MLYFTPEQCGEYTSVAEGIGTQAVIVLGMCRKEISANDMEVF